MDKRSRKLIQNLFLTAHSTQIKSVISVPIKDCIHHYPRALFNDIPRVGASFNDIPGSWRIFATFPGRGEVLRKPRVGATFYDIPRSGRSFTTYPGRGEVLRYTHGRCVLLRNTRVGANLYDIAGSEIWEYNNSRASILR